MKSLDKLFPFRKEIPMKTITLSAKDYDDSTQNYGDCTIIDNGRELLIMTAAAKSTLSVLSTT